MTCQQESIWTRLLKKSCRDNDTDCLIWNGFSRHGYGTTSYKNSTIYTHRLSYMLWKNSGNPVRLRDDDGVRLIVRHMCNNSMCFEPSHLKLGTQYENDYDDKILHGTIQRGQKHYNCSIDEKIAQEIKLSLLLKDDPSYETVSQRAERFGVSNGVVSCIDNGKSWAHLPDRNGNTSSQRKEYARKRRKLARQRSWTIENFNEAKSRIKENSREFDGGYNEKGLCWKWLKGVNSEGYGRISIFGKDCNTHIVSCEAKYNRHRRDHEVTRHLCSNKICCNPDHLEFGTPFENNQDTLRNGSNKRLKLDVAKVKSIRESSESDQDLSIRYGISLRRISLIKRYRIWKI